MSQFWNTFFNWPLILQTLPSLLKEGLLNTVLLAVLSSVIGVVIGVPAFGP